jgi:uncharacterized protein
VRGFEAMKIQVHDILPAQVKHLEFKGNEPFLKDILVRLTADDPEPIAPLPIANEIRAEVTLTRDGKTVFVAGSAHASIRPPCARCLKAVPTTLDTAFDLSLLPALTAKEAGEIELGEGDLDEFSYTNDEIDVGSILNEQLLLEKPIKILCAESCKGLCPSCGADRNEAKCACPEQPATPAFASLKDFKL